MFLVDTSIWIELLRRPRPIPAEHLARFATRGPVLQEVAQGRAHDPVARGEHHPLQSVILICDPTPHALYLEAAGIYRLGRRLGVRNRSSVDCLIAAIAIHEQVTLWHRDRDFDAIARFTSLRAVTMP